MSPELETTLPSVVLTKHHAKEDSKAVFGFWVYIMTDCVLFASLFAVFAVLRHNTFGGPSGKDIINMNIVLTETLSLLTSSFTCGLAFLALNKNHKQKVLFWFAITFILGALFLILELNEFHHLITIGDSWRRSGFLSSYFILVGTHGLHITVGLFWMLVVLSKVATKGLTRKSTRQLTMLSLFWHFLDIIWIFIFTIVFLMGVIPV